MIKTNNLIGLQQYLLSSVRVCDKFKRLETCDASAGPCSEVRMVPKKPSSAPAWSGRCSSQQSHTGCLQVTLEILQGFCIEAGAHHRGNLQERETTWCRRLLRTCKLGPKRNAATMWGKGSHALSTGEPNNVTDFRPSKRLGLGQPSKGTCVVIGGVLSTKPKFASQDPLLERRKVTSSSATSIPQKIR